MRSNESRSISCHCATIIAWAHGLAATPSSTCGRQREGIPEVWRFEHSGSPVLACRKRCDLKKRKRYDFHTPPPQKCIFIPPPKCRRVFLQFSGDSSAISAEKNLRFENAAVFLTDGFLLDAKSYGNQPAEWNTGEKISCKIRKLEWVVDMQLQLWLSWWRNKNGISHQ